jgi:hypothetical protein
LTLREGITIGLPAQRASAEGGAAKSAVPGSARYRGAICRPCPPMNLSQGVQPGLKSLRPRNIAGEEEYWGNPVVSSAKINRHNSGTLILDL